jgi:hypothetical protein
MKLLKLSKINGGLRHRNAKLRHYVFPVDKTENAQGLRDPLHAVIFEPTIFHAPPIPLMMKLVLGLLMRMFPPY